MHRRLSALSCEVHRLTATLQRNIFKQKKKKIPCRCSSHINMLRTTSQATQSMKLLSMLVIMCLKGAPT